MKKITILLALFTLFLTGAAFVALGGDVCTECPVCGADVEPGWKFCPWDGTPLYKKCPKCERTFPSTHKFCPFDGTELKPDTAPVKPTEKKTTEKKPEKKTPAKPDKKTAPAENNKKKKPATTYRELQEHLTNPDNTGRSVLGAIRDGDETFVSSAILWASFSENYQEVVKNKDERLTVDEFKKAYLGDLFPESGRPRGLAKMFDVDLKEKKFVLENVSIEENRGTVVLIVQDEKTGEKNHRAIFKTVQVQEFFLVTDMSIRKYRE